MCVTVRKTRVEPDDYCRCYGVTVGGEGEGPTPFRRRWLTLLLSTSCPPTLHNPPALDNTNEWQTRAEVPRSRTGQHHVARFRPQPAESFLTHTQPSAAPRSSGTRPSWTPDPQLRLGLRARVPRGHPDPRLRLGPPRRNSSPWTAGRRFLGCGVENPGNRPPTAVHLMSSTPPGPQADSKGILTIRQPFASCGML